MENLASVSISTTTQESRSQFFIQRSLDSSDEARTDTSSSPSMNRAHMPGSDAKYREDDGAATAVTPPSVSFSSGRRRKAESVAAAGDDKPASKQRKYERKTKRFIWPNNLHRLFVAAIFDVGLKNASPKALLSLMEAAGPNSGLTTEHLKSHLQKYRLNYERSRMEFLEYYDRSAKRNLKRRRRQAQDRASGAGSDANTMFVFPISNSKRRKGRESDSDDSDSDDSDSDTGGSNPNESSMQVDAKRQEPPQRRPDSLAPGTETQPRSRNNSQLTQNTQQQPTNGRLPLQPPVPHDRMMRVAPALASKGLVPIAPHHLPPAYAHAQPKQPSDHDRDLAAAAAVAAYRYPLGQLPGSVAGGVAGLPALTDPQWSILNSLMSPQLAGMTQLVGEGGLFPQVATGEAIARGGSSTDGFMLHEEPSDLQMQMHLAMQAQMNLHRQMLTRKVEVAQHLAQHSSMGTINSSSVTNNRSNLQVSARGYGESWGNAQQLQLQPQQYQQHQQHQDQQEHYQQQMNLFSRPSVTAEAAVTQVSVPIASARTDTVAAASIPSETVVVPTSVAASGSAEAVSSAPGLPTETKGDDDGIDLYRWDRIDLNVELDDDDLFGFLKS